MAATDAAMNEYRWSVYTLTNPIDGRIFYVGKGVEGRPEQHYLDYKRGKVCNDSKMAVIKSIDDVGMRPSIEIIAVFKCEDSAYSFESDLIKATSGLTNIIKNKQAVRTKFITLYGTMADIIWDRGDKVKQANALSYFWDVAAHEDHKKLIISAKNLLLSQIHRERVYA